MMCLGWSTKPTCASRPTNVTVAGGQAAQAPCPDITWFYLAAAGILAVGLMSGGKAQ